MRLSLALPRGAAACLAFSLFILLAPAGNLAMTSAAQAKGNDYKYEYKDGDCKYKYKENARGYKEEYKCKGHTYDRPKYKYESKSGDCKYKYEESSKGYKEEYKCKRGRQPLADGFYWPKHRKQGPVVGTSAPFSIDLGECDREVIGGLLGGVVGGVIGSQIGEGKGQVIATAAGTFLGIVIGSEIGRRIDEIDRTCAGQVFEQAPDHQTVEWSNSEEGARYRLTPSRTFNDNDGRQCREYQATILVGGREEQGQGTACRQPDGSWQIGRR